MALVAPALLGDAALLADVQLQHFEALLPLQPARELPPADFSEMMRSAMREDEWLLLAHGAVLGVIGGLVHLAVFA